MSSLLNRIKNIKSNFSIRGAEVVEFVATGPILIAVYFLLLALAIGWFQHSYTATLALQGASRESVIPGSGEAYVHSKSRTFSSSMHTTELKSQSGDIPENDEYIFTVNGNFFLAVHPFLPSNLVNTRSTTTFPQWDFVREPQ